MPLPLHHIVVDAHDLPALARFRAEVPGRRILSEREREVVIGPDETAPVGMCFMPGTDRKAVENRLHLDLTTRAADREAEIERILVLGARTVDVGRSGDESWTVLADPEWNEFCVVRPKETLIAQSLERAPRGRVPVVRPDPRLRSPCRRGPGPSRPRRGGAGRWQWTVVDTLRMDSTSIRNSYDAVADEYAQGLTADLASKPLDRAMLTAFAEQVPKGGPVADVGCGPAQVACFLDDLGVPVLGLDVSPGMVAAARRRRPGLDVRVGSMLDLPLADGELAGIAAFYSLIHLQPDERPRAYAEFARVLRPGGLVLVAFHAGEEVRHRDSWFDRPVSLDFFALRPEDVAAGLADAGLALAATLMRGPYPGEADTERAYLLARRL